MLSLAFLNRFNWMEARGGGVVLTTTWRLKMFQWRDHIVHSQSFHYLYPQRKLEISGYQPKYQ